MKNQSVATIFGNTNQNNHRQTNKFIGLNLYIKMLEKRVPINSNKILRSSLVPRTPGQVLTYKPKPTLKVVDYPKLPTK